MDMGPTEKNSGRLEVRRVPAGYHGLTAELDGYQTGWQSITLPPNPTKTIDFVLDPSKD